MYLTGSFAVQKFTETYVDNSTYSSEGSVQNFNPEENLSISSGNESKIILPEDSFSNIPSGISTPIPSQDKFNSAISLGITSGTNSTIISGDIFSIPPSNISNIPEDSFESTAYKSTPTNSKVHLADSDSLTSDHSTNPTTPTKPSNSNIHQQIWIHIFNNNQ